MRGDWYWWWRGFWWWFCNPFATKDQRYRQARWRFEERLRQERR